MGTTAINVSTPQEKHVDLLNAIDRLSEINSNFRIFIEKVNGGQSPKEGECDVRQELSLYEVLCQTPNRIADLSEQIQNKINELNELLF